MVHPHAIAQRLKDRHQTLRGRLLVPIHCRAFSMALHAWTEAVKRLLVAAQAERVAVVIPRPGESIDRAAQGAAARVDTVRQARWARREKVSRRARKSHELCIASLIIRRIR